MLSPQEERGEQESGNDSKATHLVHTRDLTGKLPFETSGPLFVNEGSECGSSSQLSHCSLESELKDQEALFVYTPSHKGVKSNSDFHDQNSDINLYVILDKNESQNSCTLQSLPAGVSDISGPDSLHSSTDSAHLTNSYCEISVEKPRIFSNESVVSEESVECSSHSSEIQHLDLLEHCTQVDRNDEETVEFLLTSKSAKEVSLEASVGDEKVLFATLMDAEKIEPGTTVSGTEIVIETSVSGGNSELESQDGRSVPETIVRQYSLPKTRVGGGSSVLGTTVGKENFILQTAVSRNDSMPETFVSGGDSVPDTTFGRGNCVLETTVIGRDSVPENLITGGESLPRTTGGRGNIVLETTAGRGSSVPETSVSGGDSMPETTFSRRNSMPYTTITGADDMPETSVSGGDSVPETTGGRGNSVLETTGVRGNCMPGTTVSGGDNLTETSVSGGDSVPRSIVPGITICGGNSISENTFSGKNNVPEMTDSGNIVSQTLNSERGIVPKTSVSGGNRITDVSFIGVVSVPETEVSRGDCIPEMSLTGQNSKLKMKVSGGDTVTESIIGRNSVPEIAVIGKASTLTTLVIGGDSVPETTVNEGCIVSDITVNGGDSVSESVISQEKCLVEFEQSDLKGFQGLHSRKKLMHETEGDGENITEALPSLGLMMNGRLPVEEDPATDPVADSYTVETGMIFDNELKKSSRVRQSYYSSLEVINVNSSNVYGDFLIEEDLLGAVDFELPCCYGNNLKPCTYISRTSKNFSDFPKQEDSLGQITEKGVSLSMNSSESDDSVFTSEEHENLESQDCDIHYHKRTNDWNQKSTIESAYIDDEQDTESFKGEDSVSLIHGHTNKINQDNFSTCETRSSVSSMSVYNDMKLVYQNVSMPRSSVLAAAHVDCLKSCDTVTSPLTSLTHLSISSTELENLQCSLLATPSIASSQSPFSQIKSDVNSDSNDVDVASSGSGNKALVVSQMEDSMASLPSSCPSKSSSCTFPQDHQISGSSEILKFRSPVYEMIHHLTPYASQKSCDISIDSEHGMQSPSEKFNDTIEEMEMMLKYGMDYGERAEENTSPLDRNENRRSHDDKLGNYNEQDYGNTANDPILNPKQKSSVASMISNFHPALESTRFSSHQEDLSVQRKGSKDIETLDTKLVCCASQSDSGPKREPLLKPPRNVHSSNVSPKKYSSFKVSTPSTPKHHAVSPIGVGEQGHVQKNVLSKERLYVSKAATSWGRGEKAKVLTSKQPAVLKSGGWTPGSQPLTSVSGLARVGSPKKLQKSSKLGQLSASNSVSTHSVVRFQHQSPGSKQSTPTLQKSSSALNGKSVANCRLPPRPTPNKTGKSVMKQTPSQTTKLHTPKERNNNGQSKVNFASKTPSPTLLRHNRLHLKQGLNIESPVAKYLEENPPPPLVVNVKPRHKISPKKIQSESSPTKISYCMLTSHQAGTGKSAHYIQHQASPKVPIDHESKEEEISTVRGETALSRIQDDLERLTLKMKGGQVSIKKKNFCLSLFFFSFLFCNLIK